MWNIFSFGPDTENWREKIFCRVLAFTPTHEIWNQTDCDVKVLILCFNLRVFFLHPHERTGREMQKCCSRIICLFQYLVANPFAVNAAHSARLILQLSLLAGFRGFLHSAVKHMISWIEVKWLTWSVNNVPVFGHKNSHAALPVYLESLSCWAMNPTLFTQYGCKHHKHC